MSGIRYFIVLVLLFSLSHCYAQFPTDPRADSLDIATQKIDLNITDFTNKTIAGYSSIKFGAKMNGVKGIYLDLFDFTIDSIKIGNIHMPYTYNDTLVKIPFNSAMSQNDTSQITVWYHGLAQQGSGGWGGFYWSQGIAFNMGVTLYDIPHNAGRFWFPCFDNFTDKAYYDVTITTQNTHSAVCGGTLLSQVTNPDLTKTWHWKLHKPVPSYLVSVAVGPFAFVNKTFNTAHGPIPVIMAALPADTTAMKNSFINLENSFHLYEDLYGPYLWERVGYVLVPFNGGAMEHATNIAYQKTLVNGALDYETVMVHELSHHWWGDLITCETAEDMWINEGMAVYSEYVFLEGVYGRNVALQSIRSNHSSVIKTAHTSDGGYQPLSGIPQAYTYGKHSYDKGGNVAWSLRGYMGDSLFYKGLRAVLNRYKFDNVNSPQFRDVMIDSTGYDVGPFFADWIMQPGFAEFLLDSFTVTPSGNQFSVTVSTSQRLRAANHLYTQVPLEITFVSQDREETSRTLMHSGAFSQDDFLIPFQPTAVFINRKEKLIYGVTADEKELKTNGNTIFSYSNFRCNVTSVQDSSLIRAEYHWAAPDNYVQNWKYELTPDRFWNIDGIFNPGFSATATFVYDGSSTGPDFPIIYDEDSVIVLYRPNTGASWEPVSNQTMNQQASGDKKGNITVPLIKGQYCIGTKRATVSIPEWESEEEFTLYPNPSEGVFNIRFNGDMVPILYQISVYDSLGKSVYNGEAKHGAYIDLRHILKSGKYTVKLTNGSYKIGSSTLIVR